MDINIPWIHFELVNPEGKRVDFYLPHNHRGAWILQNPDEEVIKRSDIVIHIPKNLYDWELFLNLSAKKSTGFTRDEVGELIFRKCFETTKTDPDIFLVAVYYCPDYDYFEPLFGRFR